MTQHVSTIFLKNWFPSFSKTVNLIEGQFSNLPPSCYICFLVRTTIALNSSVYPKWRFRKNVIIKNWSFNPPPNHTPSSVIFLLPSAPQLQPCSFKKKVNIFTFCDFVSSKKSDIYPDDVNFLPPPNPTSFFVIYGLPYPIK